MPIEGETNSVLNLLATPFVLLMLIDKQVTAPEYFVETSSRMDVILLHWTHLFDVNKTRQIGVEPECLENVLSLTCMTFDDMRDKKIKNMKMKNLSFQNNWKIYVMKFKRNRIQICWTNRLWWPPPPKKKKQFINNIKIKNENLMKKLKFLIKILWIIIP